MTHSARFLNDLRNDTLREIAAQKDHLSGIWSLPLHERVEKGHSLGPLRLVRQEGVLLVLAHETDHSRDSFSRLREGEQVRVTHDNPLGGGRTATFFADDGDEVYLQMMDNGPLSLEPPSAGYTIDPDFFDPTDRFMAALDELRISGHGCKVVLPILMGAGESEMNWENSDAFFDSLDGPDSQAVFQASQIDAISKSLAASRFHLVQGPPGTGKTHVLAEVAARLIESGQRVLLTGPTHRAIDHALRACRRRIEPRIPVVKISRANFAPDSPVAWFEKLSEAKLPDDEPYLVGSTPHNLWSSRGGLMDERFDTVLLDEASQLTPILAVLAMLRAEKFLFFGDHCQLPPVRLGPKPDDSDAESIFATLRKSSVATLLTESWRLNRDLAEWPSATFYGNRLVAKHDRRLALSPPSRHPALQPAPGFVALPHSGREESTRSPEEAETIAELVLDLLRGGLAPSDIAVVTPFRAQAALVRRLLRGRQEFGGWPMEELVADTVERLQGQEREVVIVSMAASRDAFVLRLADFLLEPRRLNVAITRARKKTVLLHSLALAQVAASLADSGHSGASKFCSLLEHAKPA